MDKKELRAAVQEMNTYQFGLKNELHNKLTKVTSYIPKKEAIDLIDQLDEPDHVVCAENERTTKAVEVPQFVADWIEGIKSGEIYAVATGGDDLIYELCQQFYEDTLPKQLSKWYTMKSITFYRAVLNGYTIEPPKTLQVIVKNYDSTVYKTDIPEDEAMKLIEGWKEDE